MFKIMSFQMDRKQPPLITSMLLNLQKYSPPYHSFQTQAYPKNQFGINQEVQDINNILYKTAQKSNLTTVKPKKKRLDTDKWFDLDCKGLYTPGRILRAIVADV